MVSLQNTSTMATIDEGAELNCIDEDFCLRNNIKFQITFETATSAGKNDMVLSGETSENIHLRPKQNPDVCWNLGKCVAVSNPGCDILIGEPAKKDNFTVTLPHKKQIIDSDGAEATMDYSNNLIKKVSCSQSHLLRMTENKILLNEENLEFALPETFTISEVVISPKKRL